MRERSTRQIGPRGDAALRHDERVRQQGGYEHDAETKEADKVRASSFNAPKEED